MTLAADVEALGGYGDTSAVAEPVDALAAAKGGLGSLSKGGMNKAAAAAASTLLAPILESWAGLPAWAIPDTSQVEDFVKELTDGGAARWAAIVARLAKDVWDTHGWAGAGTWEQFLRPSAMTAGWSGPALIYLGFAWFKVAEGWPGKGGWEGLKTYRDRVNAFKAGKTVTYKAPGKTYVFDKTAPKYQPKTQAAKDIMSISPAAWTNGAASVGGAKFSVEPRENFPETLAASAAKNVLAGDKIGVMLGLGLIKGGHVAAAAKMADAAAGNINSIAAPKIADPTSFVPPRPEKYKPKPTVVKEDEKGGNDVVLLAAAAVAAAALLRK